MFNSFQRSCADNYASGDFAHVRDIEEARAVGDTLFTFLMIELATSEGCETREEAIRRLGMAVDDIGEISAAIHRLPGEKSPHSRCDNADPKHLVQLRFRAQAWVRDYAIAVDSQQPDIWSVPRDLLIERFPTEQDWLDRDEERDAMRLEGDAPSWIRDWTGPFEVELADDEISPWADARDQ